MATLNIKNFPDELYVTLRSQAKAEHRSVAQQVIHLLDKALADAVPASIRSLKGLGKAHWQGVNAGEHVAAERDSWD